MENSWPGADGCGFDFESDFADVLDFGADSGPEDVAQSLQMMTSNMAHMNVST